MKQHQIIPEYADQHRRLPDFVDFVARLLRKHSTALILSTTVVPTKSDSDVILCL